MNEMKDLAKSLAAIRVELSARVSKMSDLIRSIEYFIDDPEKLEAPSAVTSWPDGKVYTIPGKPKEKKQSSPGPAKSTVENARDLILTVGGTLGMPTREILKELAAIKRPVKGKRPIQTLYGILYKDSKSKHPRVRRNEKGYWEAA